MGGIRLARRLIRPLCWLLFLPAICFSQDGAGNKQQIKLHFERAEAALKANHPDEAVSEFRAVLALDPKNAEARANLGVIKFVQGDYANASEELRQAVSFEPSLWKAVALLGMCEKRLGKLPSAHEHLEQSFAHLQEPKMRTQAGMDLVELDYQNGDMAGAMEVLPVLEQLNPTNVDILYIAYRTFSALAEHAVDSIALANPDSARMHQILAQHLVNEGDITGAITQYQKALELDPRLSGAHFELGEVILQNSKSESARAQAQKEFESALALNPNDAKSEVWLGIVCTLSRDMNAALKHYTRALELDPSEVQAHTGLARVLMTMGETEKARAQLLEAIHLDPLNGTAHYRLSALYRQLGSPVDAQKEMATFNEIQDHKKRIATLYQQMHKAPASSQVADSDVPE
ncbi:MAG: tetratricopeptide repeat protein [Terriglobia bacterium]